MNPIYLTTDLPGIGGQLKVIPEDFIVEEMPRYPASGQGQHVFAVIEKRGISTYAAMRKIAQALKLSSRDIGCAGLKDAHAITRQTISINLVTPEAVTALNLPNIKILSAERHHNKLKTGHLSGNRFVIRVRDVPETCLPAAKAIVARLQEKGVPNFFGAQRFGNRGNTDRLGETLIRNDTAQFVDEYLGKPQPQELPPIQAARRLVDERRWAEAMEMWPARLPDEKRSIEAIIKAEGQLEAAIKVLNRKMKSLFVSAFQSKLFNILLAQRLESIDKLEEGDVAFIHGKGAAFLVTDASVEQPRADQFKISPSGPLFGPKALPAAGKPGLREQAILAEYKLSPQDFTVSGVKVRGARRPYRFELKTPNIWFDDGLMISFELQPGAYATTVMSEIMKNK